MASQVTVTAKTGPGVQNTASVYTNVKSFYFNAATGVFTITQDSKTTDFQLSGVTTVTCSISGLNMTWVVS